MPHKKSPKHTKAQKFGWLSEWNALIYMMLKGYRPLGKRVKTPLGEIDLIVRKGSVIVFVEVKARARLGDALLSLTPQQHARIGRAARFWLSHHEKYVDKTYRCDFIAMGRWRWPVHIQGIMPRDG